jgi:uncharacterized membrane protein YedE/YeeE
VSALDLLFYGVSALCGIGFGYAAQRGSLCAVLGVQDWIERRSARQLIAFLHCSLWVAVTSVPLVWLVPGAHLAAALPASGAALLGGLLFGAGAAINGGCAFGTITRLAAGDASFLATIAGIAAAVALRLYGVGDWVERPDGVVSPLEQPSQLSFALIVSAAAFLAWRSRRGWSAMVDRLRWTPERAAAVMGLTGGLLYALNGSWAYTIAIERGVGTMMTGIGSPVLGLIFVSGVFGAAIGAWRRRIFAARLNARAMPLRFAAGVVMGVGASLIPGGNDDLVLHAIPALSPHVLVAYPALIAGAATMLIAGRSTSFEALRSVTPARALRSIVSWKISGRE